MGHQVPQRFRIQGTWREKHLPLLLTIPDTSQNSFISGEEQSAASDEVICTTLIKEHSAITVPQNVAPISVEAGPIEVTFPRNNNGEIKDFQGLGHVSSVKFNTRKIILKFALLINFIITVPRNSFLSGFGIS